MNAADTTNHENTNVVAIEEKRKRRTRKAKAEQQPQPEATEPEGDETETEGEQPELSDEQRKQAIDEIAEGEGLTDEEAEAEFERRNSVVASKYKAKYAERAAARTNIAKTLRKAAKRSTWDWLAETLAKHTLDEKLHIKVDAFEAILDANGVKHDHWNRTTPGWQGRLRMTGRLALQRVVAENGELALPDGTALPAPKAWIAKHQH